MSATESVEQAPQKKMTTHRLYINNVSYKSTEDDFHQILQDYNVLSVLVPSHTVRGVKSLKQKSLGIAYIEFGNEEDCIRARDELNGMTLNGRELRVKNFVPYKPKPSRFESKKNEAASTEVVPAVVAAEKDSDDTDAAYAEVESPMNESANPAEEVVSTASKELGDVKEKQVQKEEPHEPVSEDTLYIGRLSTKVTDGELRDLFHGYVPTEVYIFKSRLSKHSKFSFRRNRHFVSALVTLSEENGLERALVELKGKKLSGKPIHVKAAYLSKIEEVKRAAQAQQIKLEKVERDAGDASASTAACLASPEAGSVPEVDDKDSSSGCKPDECGCSSPFEQMDACCGEGCGEQCCEAVEEPMKQPDEVQN